MNALRSRNPVSLVLAAVMLLQGVSIPPSARAPGSLPDLQVVGLNSDPANPQFLSPVTVEVEISENAGIEVAETTVSLEWCCVQGAGGITRTLSISRTATVRFEHALVFPEPGEYAIRAEVDPQDLIPEDDETNNVFTQTLTVRLWSGATQSREPRDWFHDEDLDIVCPDSDLMLIGRRVPYIAQDDFCPDEWGLHDGCPQPDADGDGVIEGPVWLAEDACPAEPGPSSNDGCPAGGTGTDPDGDGIAGALDGCPDQSGVHDPRPERNGCPRPDRDGDGKGDATDDCPDRPGPSPDGCPGGGVPGDADGDGLADDQLYRDPPVKCQGGDYEADEYDPTSFGCQVYLRGQRTNGCGVTSLAYVLSYLGKECCGEPCAPFCVDDELTMWDYSPIFTDPLSIVEYATNKDLNAEIYVNGDIGDVRTRFVDQGIPVLLVINTTVPADIMESHYVVPVSFCDVEQESPPGTRQTFATVYDPNGFQMTTTPDRLERYYWGEITLGDIRLWNRLFIAISDQTLPEGNADEIVAELALAQALAMAAHGGQEFTHVFHKGDVLGLLEGLVEMGGAIPVAVLGLLSMGLTRLEDVLPSYLGGGIGALGRMIGQLTLAAEDLIRCAADLLNPENWFDSDKMAELMRDFFAAIGDVLVAVAKGVWDFIVDGIGGFFEGIGCDWFNLGCPDLVVYYKHYASPDPCLESFLFVNRLFRGQPLGYVYASPPLTGTIPISITMSATTTIPVLDTTPVYLYAFHLSATERQYFVCDRPDWSHSISPTVRLGLVGYSLLPTLPVSPSLPYTPTVELFDLTSEAQSRGMLCEAGVSLGYLPRQPLPDTELLWLMQSLDNGAYTVVTDPCAGTETFVTPVVQGYTREMVVGSLPPSETPGALPLYRFYNAGTEDCILSTKLPTRGGFGIDFNSRDELAVGDVNRDGRDEIVHADSSVERIRIYDIDGNLLGEFSLDFENGDGLAVGDANGDGRDEIIHGSRDDDRIRIYDMDGPPALGGFGCDFDDGDRLAAGDVNGDGVDEIIQGRAGEEEIRTLDMDGSTLGTFDFNFQDGDGLAVGDVNGDGVDEIVHADRSDDRVRFFDMNGGNGHGNALGAFDLDFQSGDGLAVGDVDADGRDEVIHGDRDEWIRALGMDGTLVERFELDFQDGDELAAGDMDGDGTDEVVHGDRDDRIRTNPMMQDYVNHGYVGYIYTEQQPGTVPLYQTYNADRKDHLVTLDPDDPPEGLVGYGQREILGYVWPPSHDEPEGCRCNVPLWRFCKRIHRQE